MFGETTSTTVNINVPLSRQTAVPDAMDATRGKVLTYDTIAQCVKDCQYAVRGEIYLAATERIKAGKEVIFTNVGNPHGLGQKPLTFLRQVRPTIPSRTPYYCSARGLTGWLCVAVRCSYGSMALKRACSGSLPIRTPVLVLLILGMTSLC